MKHILDYTEQQLVDFFTSIDEKSFRAKQTYKWIFHKKVSDFDEMTNLSKELRQFLKENFLLRALENQKNLMSNECDTSKYLFKTIDGHFIETVLIPEKDRRTLCISSQVGCSLACSFCATGRMGYFRNLTMGEIIEQIIQTEILSGEKITNIVFMGMGEPFLNYPRVMEAASIMSDPEGLALRKSRITISTSGIVPKIIQMADEKRPYGLALSLHAPDQETREKIMPVAKKFPLEEVMESVYYYYKQTKNRPTYEYILLDEINDSPEHAKKLKKILAKTPAKINLIPYNDVGAGFRAPSNEKIDRFIQVLLDSPITVTLRKSRGSDIQAACGQLSTTYMQAQTESLK
ncbi:MAG: bifunctional tRNA (adenosine(37)-C2)-methyltransferase TrmG/ribosomal RNA large subunit methyltransferase RlmN [Calditrichia bacterium]